MLYTTICRTSRWTAWLVRSAVRCAFRYAVRSIRAGSDALEGRSGSAGVDRTGCTGRAGSDGLDWTAESDGKIGRDASDAPRQRTP
jgi:hypothetical protein